MVITIITVKLYTPWVHSLKEKRSIVKGLTNKLRSTFNVSVIESGAQDIHQTIIISIAFLADNKALSDSISQKICDFIEANTDAMVADILIEHR
ncbi:MAG TPA: DUF503 domain-containing protein [Clostridiales bacterium]|nr:DUF503 domain-containing protein [Clostridiales bacterium]